MKIIAVWVTLFVTGVALAAAPLTSADKVQFRNGKVFISQNGALAEAKDEVALPFDVLVQTNGTFTVKGGKARKLQEGDALDRNGMLLRADGTIAPVMDHVTLNRGRVIVMKDGEATEVKDRVQLGDGASVTADGYFTPRGGFRRKLLDGELLRIEGGALPARDTVTLQDGRVMVQKDGSTLTVEPNRTITMNDGTKVFADGTVVRFNGDRSKLREGETLVIEGVKRRAP